MVYEKGLKRQSGHLMSSPKERSTGMNMLASISEHLLAITQRVQDLVWRVFHVVCIFLEGVRGRLCETIC